MLCTCWIYISYLRLSESLLPFITFILRWTSFIGGVVFRWLDVLWNSSLRYHGLRLVLIWWHICSVFFKNSLFINWNLKYQFQIATLFWYVSCIVYRSLIGWCLFRIFLFSFCVLVFLFYSQNKCVWMGLYIWIEMRNAQDANML